MIINVSRVKSWRLCKRKAFNQYHRRLEAPRSMNLVDGGAFHAGVAAGRASHDWKHAREVANEMFAEDVKKSTLLPEQEYLIEEHRSLVEGMIGCFEQQYEHEQYQIIQPECEFDVELPNSHHNCIWLHHVVWNPEIQQHYEIWGPPKPEDVISGNMYSPHKTPAEDCSCYQPHRFVGKTDAVVSWNHNIWLDEYKTTSISGSQFWDQWQLDIQPTAYIYGIWKMLGVRPRGFLLNALRKPSEAQVAGWNSKRKVGAPTSPKDYLSLEREAFFRSEDDLARVERLLLSTAMEWEEEMVTKRPEPFPGVFSSTGCNTYNRKCEYWNCCCSHDQAGSLEALEARAPDYVDLKLAALAKGADVGTA